MSAGRGMECYVDGGMGGVGEEGAIVEGEVGVGVAQDEGGNAATLEFLAKLAGEGEGDVFFGDGGAEGFAAVGAAVAGVDDGEVAAGSG